MEILKTQYAKLSSGTMLFACILFLATISIGCNNKDKEEGDETSVTDATDTQEKNSTVTEFVSFVENDQNKMALDHAYASEALEKMTSAISAKASEVDFDIKGDLDAAKESAAKITENPFETSHADEIRKAAEILSGVLGNLQVAKYPGLATEAGEVKSAAMAIDPKTLTLDQKDAVKNFFAKGSDLLKKMNQ